MMPAAMASARTPSNQTSKSPPHSAATAAFAAQSTAKAKLTRHEPRHRLG